MKEEEKKNNIDTIDSDNKPKTKKGNKDIKIIIVGNSGAGKTSFVNKYIYNKFAQTYSPTIASQFSYKIVKINDVIYRVQFWDIAGQDKNPETTGVFCKNTKGIILFCEVRNNQSREDTIKWKESIKRNIDIEKIPIILVENKCDLLGDENNYNKHFEDLEKFGENNGINKCFRTSAMNGYNVEESINYLVDSIIGNKEIIDSKERTDSIKLKKDAHQNNNGIRAREKSGCC